MIHRYSFRRSPLKDFLATQLQGARRYDRIAGFFSSSLLEVAGEALERGDYDWEYQAMDRWPDRVKEKCKTNKSFAIAHGLA
jgi:hypothetical protein